MRRSYWMALFMVGFVFGAVQVMDWWQHRHLITLDAQNADIYPVLKEISRQAGIPVLASTHTTGKVTVHFHQIPVETALDVLAEQTSGRWQKLFMLGRTRSAIQTLTLEVAEKGPPFLITQSMGLGGFFAPAPPTDPGGGSGSRIELKIESKDLHTASLELALKTKIPIVIEELDNPVLTLQINEADLGSAVNRLARAANSKSEMAYHFRISNHGGAMALPHLSPEERQEQQETRQKMIVQQIALLPVEEREKFQQLSAEREKRHSQWANLTPEEIKQKLAAMASDPAMQERFDQRNLNRIKNLTPEQRVARYQKFTAAHGKP